MAEVVDGAGVGVIVVLDMKEAEVVGEAIIAAVVVVAEVVAVGGGTKPECSF
ncbi:hypothetical protein QJS04_geneDACA000011 [Acorus gramineus]|uniref:Uncharacterized protein n=1 Tax=Acorus gramineus TaxID=55184 RepID=A0AAV9AU71_ACOGR|nr:hypothetical protein QJS04_geneDACA000011 [Acorus gramineus]